MILPHPRFFTDRSGTVPIPSQGLIESDWWPKIFFIPFKAPLPNQRYVFRKGEGIAQLLFLPKNPTYQIQQMNKQEAKEREQQEFQMAKCSGLLATRTWADANGHTFDNKYKVLSNLARKEGQSAVREKIADCFEQVETKIKEQETAACRKMTRRIIKPKKRKTRHAS